MGKQIQHILKTEDEDALIKYLQKRFPVQVVNRNYPENWNKQTLIKTTDSRDWMIIDKRVTNIILESANQLESDGKWQIRSIAKSCIEWSRDLYYSGKTPSQGRLYINTNPNDIYMDISAKTGDDIEKQFKRASHWLKKNCDNVSEYNYGIWKSRS